MNKILGVIPARWASSRFPGKPLAKLGGREMILLVYERAKATGLFDRLIIATDSEKILNLAIKEGYDAMMTLESHRCGTERCVEVVENLESQGEIYDIIINIQGDEPLIAKEQLSQIINGFTSQEVEIYSLCKKISDEKELISPNTVKAIFDKSMNALYFSRSIIPYHRNSPKGYSLSEINYYKHIGLYGFRTETIKDLVRLEETPLETYESLEQLRWLENGYKIGLGITELDNYGIDTPEDLEELNKKLKDNNIIG